VKVEDAAEGKAVTRAVQIHAVDVAESQCRSLMHDWRCGGAQQVGVQHLDEDIGRMKSIDQEAHALHIESFFDVLAQQNTVPRISQIAGLQAKLHKALTLGAELPDVRRSDRVWERSRPAACTSPAAGRWGALADNRRSVCS
jgi:hypothetical protein